MASGDRRHPHSWLTCSWTPGRESEVCDVEQPPRLTPLADPWSQDDPRTAVPKPLYSGLLFCSSPPYVIWYLFVFLWLLPQLDTRPLSLSRVLNDAFRRAQAGLTLRVSRSARSPCCADVPLRQGPERVGRVADRDAGRVPFRFRGVLLHQRCKSRRGSLRRECVRPTCWAEQGV